MIPLYYNRVHVLVLSVCLIKVAGWWGNVVWTLQRLPRLACIFGGFFDVLAAPPKWSQAMGRTRLGRKMFLHFASCPFPGPFSIVDLTLPKFISRILFKFRTRRIHRSELQSDSTAVLNLVLVDLRHESNDGMSRMSRMRSLVSMSRLDTYSCTAL